MVQLPVSLPLHECNKNRGPVAAIQFTYIEKINRYQIASLEQKDGGFNEQRYEPSPLDKIASLSPEELEEVGADDVVAQSIPTKFNFDFNVFINLNR